MKCACGTEFFTFTFNARGEPNKEPHKNCRGCYMAEKKAAKKKPAPAAAAAAPAPRDDASPARVAAVKLVPRQVTVVRRQEEDWDAEIAREPPRPPFRLRTRPRASNPRPPVPVAANGHGHARSRISIQAHDDDDAAHFPLATLPDFIAQGARPRTHAATPPVVAEPAPATPPPPPPMTAREAPMPARAPPPFVPPPTPPPNVVATPPDPAPVTPPPTPAPAPTPAPNQAPEPAPAPRRNPPRDRRAPQRLLEHCAIAYRNGDLELADDIIDCVVGMLRFQ